MELALVLLFFVLGLLAIVFQNKLRQSGEAPK
jgi:hypothetical protein